MSNHLFSVKNRQHRSPLAKKRTWRAECLEARILLAADMSASWQNLTNCNDVNQDGLVTALDVLSVIRSINLDGSRALPPRGHAEPGDLGIGDANQPMLDTNGDGFLSPADALQIMEALNGHGEGETIQVRLEVTDLDGNAISSTQVGERFQLRGYVQDLRDGDEALGVFAAYADVTYDASIVSALPSEPLTFGANYPNGRDGDVSMAGVINEIGAFANGGLGGDEELLFTVPMQADAAGSFVFASEPADILPAHEVLLFGVDDPVDSADVLFQSVEFSVENATSAAPDLFQFARDLTNAGVQFWSSHQFDADAVAQRNLFEDGASELPMSEFLDASGSISEAANNAGITDMNTWVFPDQSRATGVLSLQELSDRSGVPIPDATGPILKTIGDGGQLTVETLSPLQVPVDAYDPFGGGLSYSVSVADDTLVEATVSTGNRFWSLEVEGYGTMVFELFEDKASRATNQYITLTEDGFFDGLTFHRIISNFVIQGGDPLGTGRGGSDLPDFDDQFHVDLRHNQVGVLSMAKTADDTNNSQFFITHAPTPHLDFNHTIFGQLIEGFEVLDGITMAATDGSDRPLEDVVITRATVFQDPENAIVTVRALESSGSTTVTVTAMDSLGNETMQTIDVELGEASRNGQPFLDDIPDFTAAAGSTLEFQVGHTDIEGDEVFFFAGVDNTPGLSASTDGGLITVEIPADAVPGTDIFVDVTVSASQSPFGDSDLQRVRITVEPGEVGDAVADTFVVTEDTEDNTLDVLANDGLDDGATITSVQGDSINGTATISEDGKTILYTPDADFFGEAVVNYVATDSEGESFEAEATITVENVLDPPNARDDFFPDDLPEGDPLRALFVEDSVGDIALTTVLSNDLNVDGARQELTLITDVSDPEFGTVTSNAIQIRYTPAPDFFGRDTLTYTTTGSTTGLSSTGTITIDIAPRNDPPIGVDETLTAESGIPRLFTADELLANDAPGPENESDQSLSVVEIGYEGTGTALLNDDGNIEYTSAPGFVGTESIVYAIQDGGPGVESPLGAFVTLTINVEASGVAVSDMFTVPFESSANSLDVLANDDQSNPLEIIDTGEPENGTVSFTASAIEYTPNASFAGTDSFTYTVRDADGEESTATVTVTVQAQASVAVDDQFTIDEAATLDVLANDALGAGATTLSIDSVEQPINGTVVVAGDQVEYQPNDGFTGEDTFTYTLADDNGNTSTATVTITVEQVQNAPPVAVDDEVAVIGNDGVQSLDVLANDSALPDIDETLTIEAIVVQPENGSAVLNADNTEILYTPNAGFAGVDTLQYRIGDGNGGTATATVNINVELLNTVPIANDDSFTVVSPGVQTYNVLANDVGDAGETLLITSVQTDGTNGQVEISADGSRIFYTPDFGSVGVDTFTYTVDDGTGFTAEATVTVDVTDLFGDSFFAGSVFTDLDNDGVRDASDRGLAGVTVVLEGTDTSGNEVRQETKSDISGEFRFDGIAPGDYTVSQHQPAFTTDGRNQLGLTEVTTDELEFEVTQQLIASESNSFGERGMLPQFAMLDAFSSNRQPGLLVVLDGDSLDWAEDRGGWSEVGSISVTRDGDTLKIESSTSGSGEVSMSDRSLVQLIGRSGSNTFMRINGTSDSVLSPAAVDAAFAA